MIIRRMLIKWNKSVRYKDMVRIRSISIHRKRVADTYYIPEKVDRNWWLARILEVVLGLGAMGKNVTKDVGIRVVASRISSTKIASMGNATRTIVTELFALVAVSTIFAITTTRLVVIADAIGFGGTRVLGNIAGKVGDLYNGGTGKGCFGRKWCWAGCRGRRWDGCRGQRWSCCFLSNCWSCSFRRA